MFGCLLLWIYSAATCHQLGLADDTEIPLTDHQKHLVEIWEKHLKHEFEPGFKDADAVMDTMTDDPYVTCLATMAGGVGKESVRDFYQNHFIHDNPPMSITPISRTVGVNRLIEEMVVELEHTKRIDWLAPSVPPTGRRIRYPEVVVVEFAQDSARNWKMAGENIYWDQATVLLQLGVLDSSFKDVHAIGAEQAEKAIDPASHPSNVLMKHIVTDDDASTESSQGREDL